MSEVVTQNRTAETRSAGVTAAATLGILGSFSALFAWGWCFLAMLGLPVDSHGRHAYEANPIAFFSIALVPPLLIALGVRTSIGLFQLRPWARRGALLWATLALAFSSAVIAFRPYETFVISENFVSPVDSLRQLLAVSFVIFTFPFGAWWLVYFTRRRVIAQFESATAGNSPDAQIS
jgi:hypothetical protein